MRLKIKIPERLKRILPRRRSDGLRPTVPTAALPLFVLAIALGAIGFGLIFQTPRFENTPSYANLLRIMPSLTWGVIHVATAATMLASIRWRKMRHIAVAAHTLGIILIGSWLLAFVVRYLTDPGTTIVNVVNWSVLFFLVIRSSIELDQWVEPRPPAGLSL